MRLFKAQVERATVGQVVRGPTGPVVDVVRLDLDADQLADDLVEMVLPLV